MIFDYIIKPSARRDIDRAWEWYESKSLGRGDEFLTELHARIGQVRENPKVHGFVSRRVRAAMLKYSRYIIFYRVERKRIVITAVQHERADPKKRLRRR